MMESNTITSTIDKLKTAWNGMESNTITNTMDKVKTAWNEFDLNKWSNEVGGSSPAAEAIQAGIYFCISFGIGYVFKKHFKTIVLSLLLSALIIKGLEYYKLLEIDWNAIKNLLGVSTPADKQDLMAPMANNCVEWVKHNVIITISALIGFLLGCKLG
jgi:uncharacterized membrane protein (Fun14 family)